MHNIVRSREFSRGHSPSKIPETEPLNPPRFMKNTVEEPPITSIGQLDPDAWYTYTDYLRWRFVERVELIKGRLMRMSPAPSSTHQRVSAFLHYVLYGFFRGQRCQVFAAPFDVRLPVGKKEGQVTTVVQPDLCVICDPGKIDEQGCNGAPDLVVEILSPGNGEREMGIKFEVYQEAGVLEYWIVDPSKHVVLQYVRNEAGIFTSLTPVTEGAELRSAVFTDLRFPLGEVFRVV